MIEIPPQMFALGRLRITRRCLQLLKLAGVSEWTLLFAHGAGATVAMEDRQQFDQAVENELEIVSFHTLRSGQRIAVRTANGHSETVVMLPEELP